MSTIDMVLCPYCKKEWIQADLGIVCENCFEKMDLDVNIMSISKSIARIKNKYMHLIDTREKSLEKLMDELNEILGKRT